MQSIWDYGDANHKAINNATDSFDWKKSLSNVKV